MLDRFLDKEPFSDHRRTLPESLTTRTLEKTDRSTHNGHQHVSKMLSNCCGHTGLTGQSSVCTGELPAYKVILEKL